MVQVRWLVLSKYISANFYFVNYPKMLKIVYNISSLRLGKVLVDHFLCSATNVFSKYFLLR